MRQALRFVHDICQKPELHLLRLVGNYGDKMDILIGLRKPMCLQEVLMQIEGVSQVKDTPREDSEDAEHQLEVWLAKVS